MNPQIIINNVPAKPELSLLDEMIVEPATIEDWDKLHHLHYKAESMPPRHSMYRCMLRDELIGVIVFSTPQMLLKERHVLFPRLKPTGTESKSGNQVRARYLNDNFLRAARIVTSPIYRGAGVSYRMINLACRMTGRKYIEITSAMMRFNPFAAKSGFTYAPISRSFAYEAGIEFLSQRFSCNIYDWVAIYEEWQSRSEPVRKMLRQELELFYWKYTTKDKTGVNLGKGIETLVDKYSDKALLKNVNQLIHSQLVYGLYVNPDHGISLPKQLNLLDFDKQGLNEPLRIERSASKSSVVSM